MSQEDVIQQLKGSLAQLSEQGKKPFLFEDLRNNTSGTAVDIGEDRPISAAQEGVAMGENEGQHVGSLPRRAVAFEEDNFVDENNALAKEAHAPKPVARKLEEDFEEMQDEHELLTQGTPLVGAGAASEIEPQFVGHVAQESEME